MIHSLATLIFAVIERGHFLWLEMMTSKVWGGTRIPFSTSFLGVRLKRKRLFSNILLPISHRIHVCYINQLIYLIKINHSSLIR